MIDFKQNLTGAEVEKRIKKLINLKKFTDTNIF
ncbi:Uncharacterised protein [Listeria welshimeri]|nr:Uncharacterised protein [Listeria welshimeri]